MDRPNARANIFQRAARIGAPRAIHDQKSKSAPAIDTDGAVFEIGKNFLEPLFANLANGFRMDDNIRTKRTPKLGIGMFQIGQGLFRV